MHLLLLAVHPHIRGTYEFDAMTMEQVDGSSPHTWGILRIVLSQFFCNRFIPTYVGHTEMMEN